MKNKALSLIYRSAVAPISAVALMMFMTNVGSALPGQQANNARNSRIVLPSGTVIPMVLDSALNSKDSQRGDRFSGTVKFGNDDAGLPQGTRFEGIVQEALPSGDGKPGVLDVDFRRIIFPNGSTSVVTASLYSLDGKAVTRNDGRLTATSDKSKDRLKWVGIGAGGGLLIGALTKQNELLSTILGAGAGYLFNELGSKKPGDVNLKQGSTFGVRLDREMVFNSDERSDAQRRTQNTVRADQSFDRRPGNTIRNDDPNFDRRSNQDTGNDPRYYERRQQTIVDDRSNYGHRTYLPNDDNDIGMLVNGREVQFDRSAMPYMRGNIVMVPLAAAGRGAHFDYRYITRSRTVLARNDSVRFVLGNRVGTVEGERRRLPIGAEMRNGGIYVPMQFIDWAADGNATWDAAGRMIVLNTERAR